MGKWSVPTARSELASVCVETGARIDTFVVRMPRIILAEFNTHRLISKPTDRDQRFMLDFSRNAASSRAIPFKRMIAQVMEDPFVPLVYTSEQPGMQGQIITDPNHIEVLQWDWLQARDEAVASAERMHRNGVHKSIPNRLLEPWMWTTVVATACDLTGFWHQRCDSAAEHHMRLTAEAMREAWMHANVQELQAGEWHLPFTDDIVDGAGIQRRWNPEQRIIMSVARAASVSYKTVDGFDMTLDRAHDLYQRLKTQGHWSPFEHQAAADRRIYAPFNQMRWQSPHEHRNLFGWRQYRAMVDCDGY